MPGAAAAARVARGGTPEDGRVRGKAGRPETRPGGPAGAGLGEAGTSVCDAARVGRPSPFLTHRTSGCATEVFKGKGGFLLYLYAQSLAGCLALSK